MKRNDMEEVATGLTQPKLRIGGRPRPGQGENYIILEEPGEPVQMHYLADRKARNRKVPHFKRDCPNCDGDDEPRPYWYLGAIDCKWRFPVVLELTHECFKSATQAAGRFPVLGQPLFRGLCVTIKREDFDASPRRLYCELRTGVALMAWPYETRRELARIWGITVRPKLYREGGA